MTSQFLVVCRRFLLKTRQSAADRLAASGIIVQSASSSATTTTRWPLKPQQKKEQQTRRGSNDSDDVFATSSSRKNSVEEDEMVLLGDLTTTGSLAAQATIYLPHLIFFLYKIGQSVFSPTTKLYLYSSVCSDRYGDTEFQLIPGEPVSQLATTTRQYYNRPVHSGKQSIGKQHNHSAAAMTTALATSATTLTAAETTAPFYLTTEALRNLTTTCQDLSGAEEDIIQMEAADYIMTMKILQDVPAFVLGMFCGGWSDRVGRRLPMMLPCIGGVIVALLFSLIQIGGGVAIPGILFGVAVNSFTGRNTLVSMAVQAYVADGSSYEERTRQLGRILAMNFFGLFAGSFIMALLADRVSFWVVFLCVAFFYAAALALIYFALPESKLPVPGHNQPHGKVLASSSSSQSLQLDGGGGARQDMPLSKKLFLCCRLDNFTDTLHTIIRDRPNSMRRYLIVAYVCIVLHNMCKSGEIDVLLLFVKHTPLNWTKSGYGYLLSFQYATVGLLLIFVLPLLLNKFHLSDSAIIIGCVVTKAFGLSLLAFSDRTWMVFVSNVFVSTFGMIISCLRSIVSKMVDEDETGRCFAIISSSETVSDLLGVVFFTRLYYVGLSYPNGRPLPFIVMALIHIILLGLAIYTRNGIKTLAGQGAVNTGGYDSLINDAPDDAPSSSSATTRLNAGSNGNINHHARSPQRDRLSTNSSELGLRDDDDASSALSSSASHTPVPAEGHDSLLKKPIRPSLDLAGTNTYGAIKATKPSPLDAPDRNFY